jgi:hypothetical protein
MDVKETGCKGVDRIHVALDDVQWRILMITVMSVSLSARNIGSLLANNKFSFMRTWLK